MSVSRDELLHLIEGMPDDQVDVLLADARRLVEKTVPKGAWPPKFVGIIKDGPTDGSTSEYIDSVLGRGFGNER
jgi:hypothetical protein